MQDNQSYSKRAGTLRGLHFQAPPFAQAKLISVLRGRALDVAVDVRRGSPTFGRHVSAELSAETGRSFTFRPALPTAFSQLENDVVLNYKVSDITRPPTRAEFAGTIRISHSRGRSRRRHHRSPRRIGGFPC